MARAHADALNARQKPKGYLYNSCRRAFRSFKCHVFTNMTDLDGARVVNLTAAGA
jgi:hypothetical protein